MTSSDKKKPTRAERQRQRMAEEKRRRQIRLWVPVGIIAVLLVGLVLFNVLRPDVEGLVFFGEQSREHVGEATFATGALPPTGGAHNPRWQNCGIYSQPIDNDLAVHSLEHGAVWIAYRPDLAPEKVEDLRDLVRGRGYILMSPYPGLESEVVMSAWSRQLVIDTVPDDRVDEFIDRYRQKGPEPGALCTQGVGIPDE